MFSAGAMTRVRWSLAMTDISRANYALLHARSSIILGLALPCLAAAQESVPTDLALALLRFGSERPATILVGRVPETYAADVNVPRGARVLGSLVSSRQTTVIVTGPGSADSLRAGIERKLLERGWTRFQPPFGERGGFINEVAGRFAQFCKSGSSSVNVSTATASEGMAQARLDFGPDRGMCDTSALRAQRDEMMMSRRPLPFPALTAPPGSGGEAMQECFDSRRSPVGARSSTATLVRTTMSAADLLAFYGTQLSAQGWKPTSGRESAAWTTRDSTGTSRTVVLNATRAEGTNCYEVQMSLSAERD
jgi:hypothetical protein